MLESKYQSRLKKKIKKMFPGCFVFKTDPSQYQGFPDLLVIYEDKWAALECKRSQHEHRQPNQEDYVDLLDRLSFARFIYPENEEEVLYELQRAFRT